MGRFRYPKQIKGPIEHTSYSMFSAYVMISTELGSEEQVVKNLKTIPQIKETYIVYGIYDLITRVEFVDKQELSEVIMRKIRGTPGIKNTITLMVI